MSRNVTHAQLTRVSIEKRIEGGTYFGIKISSVEINDVEVLALNSRMKHMLWRSSEVATMEIPKHLGGPDEGRFESTVTSIDSLFAFEQEQ